MAAVSAVVAGMIALFVREPVRGRFLTKREKGNEAKKKAQAEKEKAEREAAGIKEENGLVAFVKNMVEVFKLPCTRSVLLGGFLRNFAGCIITYYLPVFFGKNYPEMKTTYSLVNAVILSGGGILASLVSGILADKLENKSYWSKGIICMVGQSLAVPFLCLATLNNQNFWLSICSYAAYFLIGSTYVGPAITMMQNTAPTHLSGSVVSVYFFSITIAQTIAPTLFSMLVKYFGALTNPAMYGPLIAGFAIGGFGLSIPCWYNAGKHYNAHMI